MELRGVSKRFYFYEHRTSSLREWFIRRVLRRPLHVRHAAFSLRDLDLRVEPGEAVALLGHNGSGKSTVLRLVAGIYRPSSRHDHDARAGSPRSSSSARASTPS